jgi:hypothetical protein
MLPTDAIASFGPSTSSSRSSIPVSVRFTLCLHMSTRTPSRPLALCVCVCVCVLIEASIDGQDCIAMLPEKRRFGNLLEGFVEERRLGLERYLQVRPSTVAHSWLL